MKIAMIGSGYVGLVSGAYFAEFGLEVICVDTDADKIAGLKRGEIPIYEPGLDTLVARNTEAGRLAFTTDLAEAVAVAAAVFIAVGTPTRRGDGHADLSHVTDAATAVLERLRHGTVLVTKSTVPVGTGAKLRKLAGRLRPDLAIDIALNPEFLREGSAIEDFMRPDQVVCGVESERARTVLAAAYRPLNLLETPILFTDLENAELIKYATNSFLAMKITFINELVDLCEAVGADVKEVARGIGLDGRIGRKFLHASPGYGGSCFPKDTLALPRTAEQAVTPLRLVETTVNVNEQRKRRMAQRVLDACGGKMTGRKVAVLGVAFKPNTDDMRQAPSLVILPALQAEGARVRAFDPEAMDQAAPLLPEVEWCDTVVAAVDAVVVLTEWNVFRALDLHDLRRRMRGDVLVDLRNVYDPNDAVAAGLTYSSIGRAPRPRHLLSDAAE